MIKRFTSLVLALFVIGLSSDVWATAPPSLVDAFQSAAADWIDPLRQAAKWLLLTLATISVVWKFGLLALQQADFQEFVVELVRMILFVGFFLALIEYADTWSEQLIEGFAFLATQASGTSGYDIVGDINPTRVLMRGLDLSTLIYNSATGWASSFVYALLTIPIIIFYALIAAFVLLVFCETYFVTAAGVILLGFGGNQWTNDYAVRYITYCVSVGMKLFVTLLIVGLGEQLINGWAVNVGNWAAIGTVFSLIGVLMLLVVLVWMLPNLVQGIVNGASLSSGSGSGSFGAVAGLAGGAAIGAGAASFGAAKSVASGASAVQDAVKLAQSQVGGAAASAAAGFGPAAALGGAAASAAAGFGPVAALAAKNVGQAVASVAGDWARGQSSGGQLMPQVASAVHAAREKAERTSALQDAGSGAGGGGAAASSGASAVK